MVCPYLAPSSGSLEVVDPPLSCPSRGPPWGVPTLCQRYCVNCIRSPISHREVNLKSLILRCHAPAGAPLGGPNSLSTLLCQLDSVPHIIHDRALAYSFLCVARTLPLSHVPRFPFHDSTGFCFCCKTNGKPYILGPIGPPEEMPK